MERDTSRLVAGLGAITVLVVAGVLVPLRDWLGPSNMALVLVLVVVGAAAFGGRLAGAVTSVVAALSFDFLYTQPYLTLRINEREDIITFVLLLVVGVAVGELAALRASSRRDAVLRARSAARLEAVTSLVASGADVDEIWPVVRDALVEQLDLVECRFEPSPYGPPRLTELEHTGHIAGNELHWVPGGFELPTAGVELPVSQAGHRLGRIVLMPTHGTGTSIADRRAAVALADQLAVAASKAPTLHPLT